MGACPQKTESAPAADTPRPAAAYQDAESTAALAPNLFYQRDMMANLKFVGVSCDVLHEDVTAGVYVVKLAPGVDEPTDDSSFGEVMPAVVDYEEAVYDDDGNVVEVIQHFKKSAEEVRQELEQKQKRRQEIISGSLKSRRRKLPTPKRSFAVNAMRREEFQICLADFAPNSRLLYVLLSNATLLEMIYKQRGGIFEAFSDVLKQKTTENAELLSSDSTCYLPDIVNAIFREAATEAASTVAEPEIVTLEWQYYKFAAAALGSEFHRHFGVVFAIERRCAACRETSTDFDARFVLHIGDIRADFMLSLAAYFAPYTVACPMCGAAAVCSRWVWSVGRQIIVQFREGCELSLPRYIFLYQFMHPEAPLRRYRVFLATAAGDALVWLRKGRDFFRIDENAIVAVQDVSGAISCCCYEAVSV